MSYGKVERTLVEEAAKQWIFKAERRFKRTAERSSTESATDGQANPVDEEDIFGEHPEEDLEGASGEDFEEASGGWEQDGAEEEPSEFNELDNYDSEEVVAEQLRMDDQGSGEELYASDSDLE